MHFSQYINIGPFSLESAQSLDQCHIQEGLLHGYHACTQFSS